MLKQLSLAIKIPDSTKELIVKQLRPLKHEYEVFHWVPSGEYVIELFNFGRVDNSKIEPLSEMIERGVYDIPSFTLYSDHLHMLLKNNITFYAGFHTSKPIQTLVKQLKQSFKMDDNLVFFPHLPVAKYKMPSKQQYLLIKKKCASYEMEFEIEITQITLLNSVIENNKLQFETEKEYVLVSNN
jgi:2'-5' RNA ligase